MVEWIDESKFSNCCAATSASFTMKDFKSSMVDARRAMWMLECVAPKEKFVEYESKDYDPDSPWVLLGFIKKKPKIDAIVMNAEMILRLDAAINDMIIGQGLSHIYGIPVIESAAIAYGEVLQMQQPPNQMFESIPVSPFRFPFRY